MGLVEGQGGGGSSYVFLAPINVEGKGTMWARRVNEGTEGATPRESKAGLVHELYYGAVIGRIKTVRIFTGQYGEDIEISLSDGKEVYIIKVGFSSPIGKAFIVRLPNISKDNDILIGVTTIEEKQILYAKQSGSKIENAYSKDNEAGLTLPPPEKKDVRGTVTWDWGNHEDALFALCESKSIENGWSTEDNFSTTAIIAGQPIGPEVDKPQDEKDSDGMTEEVPF